MKTIKRKCTWCKKLLPLTSYSKKRFVHGDKVGLCSECRDCASRRATEWRKANREKFNAYQRKYQKNDYYKKKFAKVENN